MTKAALYYHFRTKEDIVTSLVEDRIRTVDELIAWAETAAPHDENRRELIRRYCAA